MSITYVRVETEDFKSRMLPLYELPFASVVESMAGMESARETGMSPEQMLRTANLVELAVLDGEAAAGLKSLSYAQFGSVLNEWVTKSSDPGAAFVLDLLEGVGDGDGDGGGGGSDGEPEGPHF